MKVCIFGFNIKEDILNTFYIQKYIINILYIHKYTFLYISSTPVLKCLSTACQAALALERNNLSKSGRRLGEIELSAAADDLLGDARRLFVCFSTAPSIRPFMPIQSNFVLTVFLAYKKVPCIFASEKLMPKYSFPECRVVFGSFFLTEAVSAIFQQSSLLKHTNVYFLYIYY